MVHATFASSTQEHMATTVRESLQVSGQAGNAPLKHLNKQVLTRFLLNQPPSSPQRRYTVSSNPASDHARHATSSKCAAAAGNSAKKHKAFTSKCNPGMKMLPIRSMSASDVTENKDCKEPLLVPET